MLRSRWFAVLPVLALAVGGCGSNNGGGDNTGDDSGATTTPSDDSSTATDAPVDTGPAPLAYPPGPYGLKVTQIFPNITMHMMRGPTDLSQTIPSTQPYEDVQLAEYYDPDGSKGITAIYVDSSAVWCPHCKSEAAAMPNAYAKNYYARGARFITLMVQDVTGSKGASENDGRNWARTYKSNFPVGIDPLYYTFVYPHPDPADTAGLNAALSKLGSSIGFPTNYVIDPRTMKIYRKIPGADDYHFRCSTTADCCPYNNPPDNCVAKDSSGTVVESPQQDYVCEPTMGLCVGADDSASVGFASVFAEVDLLITRNKGKAGPATPPPRPVPDAAPEAAADAAPDGSATDSGSVTDAAAGG